MCVIEAVDIRSHDPHVVLPRHRDHLVLQLDFAHLSKARGNHDSASNSLLTNLFQCAGYKLSGNREHGDINRVVDVLDALVALVSENLIGLRIDRVDLALIATVDQVLHYRIADLAFLTSRADNGHCLRLHDTDHRS